MAAEQTYSKSTLDAVCAGLRYQIEKSEKKCARAEWEGAARAMELQEIHCRMAEIHSQHDPLAALLKTAGIFVGSAGYEAARKAMLKAAFYVAYGRITDQYE